MKVILFFISLLLCYSCKNKTEKVFTIHNNEPELFTEEFREDKYKFTAIFDKDVFLIKNEQNDTIYINKNHVASYEIKDVDKDEYKDFIVRHISNYSSYDIGFYDKNINDFQVIEDFDGEPQKISGTQYYYSYAKAGCADSNWYSDLFYIENYKIITVGKIVGIGCIGEEKNGIFIYSYNGEKENLKKFIPREAGYYNDKWEFIKKYWTENYMHFNN